MRERFLSLYRSTFVRIAAIALALAVLGVSVWSLATNSSINSGDILVSARPAQIFLVRSDLGQHLNFDFLLTNSTDETLTLEKIELGVFDDAGKLARREFYDDKARHSLELSSRDLKGGRTMMLYNPFHTFAADVPLKKLHYEFSFRTRNSREFFKADVVVSPVEYETKTNLILPLRGRVLVWDGHDYNAHHRRRDYSAFIKSGYGSNHSRYSYDFVLVDERGNHYKGRPRTNDDWYNARPDNWGDYYGFGATVYAAGTGRVVLVKDTKADDRTFDEREFETDENSPAGNYVVIDHLNGEFSVFAHLKQGSVRVKPGQMVQQGEVIAAVGASGSSLFPHLHYELRNGAVIRNVEGLPSYFSGFQRILGSRSVDVTKGAINTGDIVTRR